jgi:hypothetical protein
MADITFITGQTKTGRGYLAVKETCQVATFEKGCNSVQFLVKDRLTNKGLRIIASYANTDDVVIGMSKAKGLDQPENWNLKAYNLNENNENESMKLYVGDIDTNIIIEEV